MRYLGLFVLSLLLSGCVTTPDGEQISTWATRLNERQIQSCVSFTGNAGPYFSIHGITATGGADLATCLGQRW
jgi:hypothetical protein